VPAARHGELNKFLMAILKVALQAVLVVMPWPVKRWFLIKCFGYRLDASARIGFSWVYPRMLVMEAGSRIGSLCTMIHLDEVILKAQSKIGRGNWVTGFPSGTKTKHFVHQPDRVSRLVLGAHSAITKNHHIDCTSPVEIGDFTTVAGYHSQILTHSIDLLESRQDSKPIKIGDYCLVGTNVVVLGGAELPSFSVLAAKSLLNKRQTEEWSLYAGVPAQKKADMPKSAKYFSRPTGFVD
jgi:acetyltransferase-like isoleucine patch superfamily enzyme